MDRKIIYTVMMLAAVMWFGSCSIYKHVPEGRYLLDKVEVVALKNNLLYDAAATPNLQLEIRLVVGVLLNLLLYKVANICNKN